MKSEIYDLRLQLQKAKEHIALLSKHNRRKVRDNSCKDKPTYVYALQAVVSGLVKVGITTDIKKRKRDLQNGCGQSLNLLMLVEGTTELEKSIHSAFKDHRLEGEWFKPDDVLLAFIDSLKEVHGGRFKE